ncbi:hypothetical protein SBADM41S_01124 [Streptomyces badius]
MKASLNASAPSPFATSSSDFLPSAFGSSITLRFVVATASFCATPYMAWATGRQASLSALTPSAGTSSAGPALVILVPFTSPWARVAVSSSAAVSALAGASGAELLPFAAPFSSLPPLASASDEPPQAVASRARAAAEAARAVRRTAVARMVLLSGSRSNRPFPVRRFDAAWDGPSQ